MNVYEKIMQGLSEVLEYQNGGQTARTETVSIAPIPDMSASDVKEIRHSLNMTQRTFAAVMGVSSKTVEAWEKGTNTPAGTARRMMSMLRADHNLPEKYEILINR